VAHCTPNINGDGELSCELVLVEEAPVLLIEFGVEGA